MNKKKDSTKTFVIVGGAGLLGAEIASCLAATGNNIVIADFNTAAAESVRLKLLSERVIQSQVIATSVNIVQKNSILKLIKTTEQYFGRIDGVVNSAYPRNGNYGKRFEDVEFEDFCENTNLHLGGYFLISQQFAEYFAGIGGGSIVNIASVYGAIAPKFSIYEDTSMTMPVEYAVIKSGLIHLSKYVAKYYQGKGIQINTISPGGILDGQPEKFIDKYNSHCLSKGMLSPTDIANAVDFLLSGKAAFINGQNLIVDDGFSI
jgi:NAD(P)-dependent dehydrogenase (short-subunit alcohol dehydrogenase family)